MKSLLIASTLDVASLFALPGCTTAPTQQQEVAINSAVCIPTVAYITRAKTAKAPAV